MKNEGRRYRIVVGNSPREWWTRSGRGVYDADNYLKPGGFVAYCHSREAGILWQLADFFEILSFWQIDNPH